MFGVIDVLIYLADGYSRGASGRWTLNVCGWMLTSEHAFDTFDTLRSKFVQTKKDPVS